MKKLLLLLLVPLLASANVAPTISGTPPKTALVGVAYSFKPIAKDPDGKKVYFVIKNRPRWLTFSYSTGQVHGEPGPGDVGVWSNITIYVKDGVYTKALPTFSITVSTPAIGSSTIAWIAPTKNTDGTTLTNLAGFRIYYGKDPNVLSQTITLSQPTVATHVVNNLTKGPWYFRVTAYTTLGVESAKSSMVSKTIG